MQSRPLHWWSDDALAQLKQRFCANTENWHRTWGVPAVACAEIQCRRAHETVEKHQSGLGDTLHPWLPVARDQNDVVSCWLKLGPFFLQNIYQAMYQTTSDEASGPAFQFAEKAGHDWLFSMGEVLGASIDPVQLFVSGLFIQPSEQDLLPWSGAIRVEISAPFDCTFHMTRAHAQTLIDIEPNAVTPLSKREPLALLTQVLAPQKLSFNVQLHDVELSLGQIQSLRLDDIVTLPHRLDQPFTMFDQENNPICAGYLGRDNAYQALQIIQFSEPNLSIGLPMTSSETGAHAQSIQLNTLNDGSHADSKPIVDNANPLHSIKTTLQVCVGSAALSVGELLRLKEHQVIRLDQPVNHPVDIMLDGKAIARGNLVAVDGNFAIQLTELPVALNI